jgi:D-serine deaminase-like pyridoxal phosphate-dependent protein
MSPDPPPWAPRLGADPSALDTPSLIVDRQALLRNIEALMSRLGALGVSVRPHLKTAKCAEIARLLLAAGARGCCVAKLGEAEVLAEAGVGDLLITTEIAGQPKLARLTALLARHPQIKLVVDSTAGARALNDALAAARCRGEVLIDLDVGQRRTGALPGAPALELAAALAALPALQLVGVQGYEGHLQLAPDAERERDSATAMRLLTDTAAQLRAAGHRVDIVSTGGTGTAELCARHAGVTEVQPGSFVFMDGAYRRAIGTKYEHALSLVATVISAPRPREAVIDAGLKALSTDSGPAEPKGLPGMRYRPAGDEHGILSWDEGLPYAFTPGDRIELYPSHIDTTVHLHDSYHVFDAGRLVAVWPIAARGKVQ